VSTNGGAGGWINVMGPKEWTLLASSVNCEVLVATASVSGAGDYLYVSKDVGLTWTTVLGTRRVWKSLYVTYDGSVVYAGPADSVTWFLRSTDGGVTFLRVVLTSLSQNLPNNPGPSYSFSESRFGGPYICFGSLLVLPSWSGFISSQVSDGCLPNGMLCSSGACVRVSTPPTQLYRTTYDSSQPIGYGSGLKSPQRIGGAYDVARGMADVASIRVCSGTLTTTFVILDVDGEVWVSVDDGATWVHRDGPQMWGSLACSEDGLTMYGGEDGGPLYKSSNGGVSWSALSL
jgi:hypothetical protein